MEADYLTERVQCFTSSHQSVQRDQNGLGVQGPPPPTPSHIQLSSVSREYAPNVQHVHIRRREKNTSSDSFLQGLYL